MSLFVIERWIRVRGAWVEGNTSGPFEGGDCVLIANAMARTPNTALRVVERSPRGPEFRYGIRGAETDGANFPDRFASDTRSLLGLE